MIIHSLEELNEVLLGDDGEVELLGTPTTTEPPEGSDDLRIATTAFVRANGSTTVVSNELDSTSVVDALSANMGRVLDVDKADLASPAFTGIPTIKVGEADLAVATESYVITNSTKVNVVDGVVSASATDALSANQGRLLDGAKANLASPVFTGDPTAKTQDSGNSSKRLATTEFVMDNSSQNTGTVTAVTGGTGITTGGSATAITLSHTAHTGDVLGSGSNTSLTIKDSVALGGNPTTTTQSSGNNSTRIATTAFVMSNSINSEDNAATATKLATARTIDITGDITATAVAFDGSANISISAAVNNNSHSHTTSNLSDTDVTKEALNYAQDLYGTGVTTTEFDKLDGLTPTTTELNYVDGVTSAIQTQLNAKAALVSPAFTGTPTAPTQSSGDSSSSLATTAFVVEHAGDNCSDMDGGFADTTYASTDIDLESGSAT